MPGVAVDQRRPEPFVVVSVPQFPQRDGDVVEPVTESAVVEIDDPDLVAPEQRVVEVQIGVDEAEIVGPSPRCVMTRLMPEATRANLRRRSSGRRSHTSAALIPP
jgi:hypothetical protein